MARAEESAGWREVYRWAACDPDMHEEQPRVRAGLRPGVLPILCAVVLTATALVLAGVVA